MFAEENMSASCFPFLCGGINAFDDSAIVQCTKLPRSFCRRILTISSHHLTFLVAAIIRGLFLLNVGLN